MKKASSGKLWIFVCFGFACLIAAYVVMFKVSHAAQIREVPLATGGAKP
ncbi:MAG: hypothetical protein ABI273_22165 [Lacunisphaera sp.]